MTRVSREATSKRNRVSDWGTVNVQRSTLPGQQAPSFLLIEEDSSELVHEIALLALNNDDSLVVSRSPLGRFTTH